ncbi:MAG: RNA polymerase subunit sigma-70 [Lachnospiraceae bacterium]|nr:RNA polymerase subunit sigma-70 [Lachnospiraceae bacterium]
MTEEQKVQIAALREQGNGYKKIAQLLSISENTVKSFCKRNCISRDEISVNDDEIRCQCCGKTVKQNPGRKRKKFCSDRCRMKLWYEHLDQVQRKANYEYVCPVCKKTFTVYGNAHRKYCSHECYIVDRFGGRA